MDLDLNEHPEGYSSDSLSGLDSLLSEIETAHECIEERIRQLEAVTTRARQRQRWRQSQIRLQTIDARGEGEPISNNIHSVVELLRGDVDAATQETTFRASRFGSDGAHLVAKALSTHVSDQNAKSNAGNFFDCNICLDMATDPVLTSCGHLFCWPCFYQLSYVYSDVKECPVCMEQIPDTDIVPIYGNGNGRSKRKCESKGCGLEVPPRPNAHRIEGVRQKLINSGAFYPPVEETIRQFSNTIIARSVDERTAFAGSSEAVPTGGPESIQGRQSSQVSRLLLQGAASFSSLSSALNSAMDSAERLIEDLEALIHIRHARRSRLHFANVVTQTNVDTVADNAFDVRGLTPAFGIGDVDANAGTSLSRQNRRTDTQLFDDSPFPSFIGSYSRRSEISRPPEVSSTPNPSSATRRRTDVPEVMEVENEPFHVPRRRRLR